GEVIYIDRFGNLITNLRVFGEIDGEVKFKGVTINKISKTYSDVGVSEVVALVDSSELIEIGIRNGSAQEFFKAGYGDDVLVQVKKINIR
ncbi:MAG: SAM hydroxide adenosyltransferase, partial [Candidatus Kryptonium sp.]